MTVLDIDASSFLQQGSTLPNIISVVPSSSIIPDQQQLSSQGIPVSILDQEAVIDENISDVSEQDDNDARSVSDVKNMNVVAESFVEGDENSNPNGVEKRSREEVILLKGSKKHASCEMKFNSFQINWNKISDSILDQLKKLQDFRNGNSKQPVPRSLQISKTDLSGLVNAVVDQLRTIDKRIRAEVIEGVARQIINKFPCLNFVDDDGFGTGMDYVWLKHKMINRNTYLNRFKEPNQPKASSIETRRNRNLRAGTVKEYWQKSTQVCPKEILSILSRNEPEFLTRDFLETSQSFVRYRFDENIPLKDVVANFPVLRRRCLLNYHFECATGVTAGSLEQYFSAKRSKIIDFSMNNRKIGLLDSHASDYDIFKFLCRSLGEKIDDVIILKEVI